VDLKDIKAIIDLMKKNSISEFELEKQEFKIRLKRGTVTGGAYVEEGSAPPYLQPANTIPLPSPGTASIAIACALVKTLAMPARSIPQAAFLRSSM